MNNLVPGGENSSMVEPTKNKVSPNIGQMEIVCLKTISEEKTLDANAPGTSDSGNDQFLNEMELQLFPNLF